MKRPELRLLVPSLEGGGSEGVLTRLCTRWHAAGLRVEVVVVRGGGAWQTRLPRDLPVVNLGCRRARGVLWPLLRHVRAHGEAPLLVFGVDLGVMTGLARLAGLLRGPVSFREGSLPSRNVPKNRHWLYRAFVARCDRFLAQSTGAAAELAGLGCPPERTWIVPNPLDTAVEALGPVRPGPFRGPRLVGVGRLSPEKGFDRLVRAFAGVRSQYPQAQLVVHGEGASRESLISEATRLGLGGSVALPGRTDEVARRMLDADVFVLPSRYEGLPNALMEAIGLGMRVVAVDSGSGVRELMERCGLGGFLMDAPGFEGSLGAWVRKAEETPGEVWMRAAAILREWAGSGTVADAYWNMAVAGGRRA